MRLDRLTVILDRGPRLSALPGGCVARVAAWSSRPPEGEERYAELVARAADVVVGLDFDGTLAPIVDDPADGPHPPGRAARS